MGLDTTYDCWHGSYSGFGLFRNAVAVAAGHPLRDSGCGDWQVPAVDWTKVPEGASQGDWPETPEDPLMILFAHSDCDGVIRWRQAEALADAMEKVLPNLEPYWLSYAQQFIAGLRKAVAAKRSVEFQ